MLSASKMGCISSKAQLTEDSDDEGRNSPSEDDRHLLDSSSNTTGAATREAKPELNERQTQRDFQDRPDLPAAKQSPHSLNRRQEKGAGVKDLGGGETSPIMTVKGKVLLQQLTAAYKWKELYTHSCQDFLTQMDKLFMECQMHLSALSSQVDAESRKEVDALVREMVVLRKHWGPHLLPNSVCNAFVRERILLSLGGTDKQQFRIDCAQFFEPVPFYGTPGDSSGLMKLFRFSVYDLLKNVVVLRYYLEQSNVEQLYHVLCYVHNSQRGQVHPYAEMPSYWELRQHMLDDIYTRLASLT